MKITQLKAQNIPPINHFEVSKLGNVVIVAGANGSGKTRLKGAISNTFRSPNSPQVDVHISATRPEERSNWGAETLEVTAGSANPKLHEYMNSRTRGGTYIGTVIQIDSDRSVQAVKFQTLTFGIPDPDDTEITYTYYLSPFINRWPDLVNKIYQKAASRDHKIAQFVKQNPGKTGEDALKGHPDPFIPYQEVFVKLLPGKKLEPIDPKQQREFHYRVGDSNLLPFNSLGSGEQEVVRVVFDLIWKRISHCVILLDEPDLHLHPTLTFRLIETLKDLGGGTNQFFFFTHSADLISTYYGTGNVYFIESDIRQGNQARQLSTLDRSHSAIARKAAANLGVFAVGKKILFVEGEKSSVDRLAYHKISQARFPELYVLPIGSVENISALRAVVAELEHAVFGIELFMIRDRDGLSSEQVKALEANAHMRCLKRRHIENYFLDPLLLSKVATNRYLPSAVTDSEAIEDALLEAARRSVKTAVLFTVKEFVRINGSLPGPSVRDVDSKQWADVEKELVHQIATSQTELGNRCSKEAIAKFFAEEKATLEASLNDGSWKNVFPGKIVFTKFCADFLKDDAGRIQQAYVDLALSERPEVLQDIIDIFDHFKTLAPPPSGA